MRNLKTLNGWYVTANPSPWTPPECVATRLGGKVENHPRFPDGTTITISLVNGYDPNRGILRTHSGSYYRLGDPATDYAAQFPDCRERIEKSLLNAPRLDLSGEEFDAMSETDARLVGTEQDYRLNPHLLGR